MSSRLSTGEFSDRWIYFFSTRILVLTHDAIARGSNSKNSSKSSSSSNHTSRPMYVTKRHTKNYDYCRLSSNWCRVEFDKGQNTKPAPKLFYPCSLFCSLSLCVCHSHMQWPEPNNVPMSVKHGDARTHRSTLAHIVIRMQHCMTIPMAINRSFKFSI